MPLGISIAPNADAVGKIARKKIVPSKLLTQEWASMPLDLRERAQFSAGVESGRFLQGVQDKLLTMVGLQRERLANGNDATVGRSDFISDLRKIALSEGLQPSGESGKYGTLQDPTSLGRLALIHDMQTQGAEGYAQYAADQNEGALDEYPAQELVRVESRLVPRDWPARWAEAGGRFFGGRMIALKTDGIWERINRFGVPWPPFDFNSGMGLEDVAREDAEALGVIAPRQRVAPGKEKFNAKLEASVTGLDPVMRGVLKEFFGKLVDVAGDVVRWKGATA